MSLESMFGPRIWEGLPGDSLAVMQCDNCACATPGTQLPGRIQPSFIPSDATAQASILPGTIFQEVADHTVALGERGDRPLVLDSAAMALVGRVSRGARFGELREAFSQWPVPVLAQALEVLESAGIVTWQGAPTGASVVDRPAVLSAWLHLTNRCNLACAYCYVWHSDQCMTVQMARVAVEAVFRSAVKQGFAHIRLKYAGGEPVLNLRALQAAHQRAESLVATTGVFLDAVMLTNGTRLSNALISYLLRHRINVMLSLDGIGRFQDGQRPRARDGRGSFPEVQTGLERLLAQGLAPFVSVTVTEQNLGGLPEVMAFLIDRRVAFGLNFVREGAQRTPADRLPPAETLIAGLTAALRELARDVPDYSLLVGLADRADLSIPHTRACSAGLSYLVIGHDGRIAKCQMDLAATVTDVTAADPLADLLVDGAGLQNLPIDQRECRDCAWRYRCAGGCPRLAYSRNGHYAGRSPLCEVYRAIMVEVLNLEGLRLLRYAQPRLFVFH